MRRLRDVVVSAIDSQDKDRMEAGLREILKIISEYDFVLELPGIYIHRRLASLSAEEAKRLVDELQKSSGEVRLISEGGYETN